jgi:NADPH-dependent curcumin reductase CurA
MSNSSRHCQTGGWLQQGLLIVDEQVEIGIENAIPVFLRLFSGAHDGKLILQLR